MDTNYPYLAGFFDGEGSISITARKSARSRSLVYRLQVSVSNTDPQNLRLLRRAWGGEIYVQRAYLDNRHKRICYAWHLIVRATNPVFLKEIIPYLKMKRPQAELALKFLDECFDTPGHHFHPIPVKIHRLRAKYKKQMSEMNHRNIADKVLLALRGHLKVPQKALQKARLAYLRDSRGFAQQ